MKTMIIPSKVRIGGFDYNVKFQDIIIMDGKTTWAGAIKYDDVLIEIFNSMHHQRQCETFLHEVVHGILHEAGFDEHDEEIVDTIAKGFYQVLRDNNLFSDVGQVAE